MRTHPLSSPAVGQLVRFGAVGVLSTLAYAVLYLGLRPLIGAWPANAASLLLTAVANTAVNRRLTFGRRDRHGVWGDHLVGLLVLLAGVALTSGALLALHRLGVVGAAAELVVLTAANVLATLLRFSTLRWWLSRSGPQSAGWSGR